MKPRDIIWQTLLAAAKAGAPCPSDAALSKAAGMGHLGSANTWTQKWRREGKIEIQNKGRTRRRIRIEGHWTGWTKHGPRRPYGSRSTAPVTKTTRTCLCCQGTFESEGIGERVCGRCKGTAAWRGNAIAV